jgi:polar amino acid transport system substrate-binding protein
MVRWTFVLALCLGVMRPGWSETLTVFGAEDYPVICYVQDGKPRGVFPQILAGVSRFSGDTYDLQLFPWKRSQKYAAEGKGAVAHFSKTAAREEQFDFSDRVYGDRIQLVTLKGREFEFNQLSDLAGKHVGAKSGASFGQKVDAFFASDAVDVDRDAGPYARLHKLLLGRIDVAVVEGADSDIERLLGGDPDLQRNKARFVFLPEPLIDDALYLAFAKTMRRKDALERFNAGLEKFRKTPAYKKLALP